ncbi:MAG: SDR family NAD(P)-dependent oxidoreductase [Chloroflexi bacterium]|nr:SDR family NAD(P)-dependent oxidoreductase [Chloroflexota bacterium]
MNREKTILITGATSGIGLELARLYARQSGRLVLVGRRPLSELSDPLFTAATYCQADLAQAECAEQIASFLAAQRLDRLDLLIHNAGVGYYGDIAAQSAASIDELLAVNLLAPIRLTYALYPLLRAARGKVAFISTAATAVPTADYAVYGATKAALEGFARSLRVEWQGQIAVQTIRPGATATPMHAKLGIPLEKMDWRKFPSAEETAVQIARAIKPNKRQATIGLNNQLLTFAGRNGRVVLDPLLRRQGERETRRTGERENGRRSSRLLVSLSPCLITGAADGIGRALAWEFGRAGYAVIGVDVDATRAAVTAAELQQAGLTAHFITADLSKDDDLARLVEEIRPFAPLQCLIHNAGISAVGRFEQVELAAQERVIVVNLRAPLQLTAMLAREGLLTDDVTVGLLSSLSHYASYPGAAVYAASKDGVAHYARSLAVAWPPAHTLTVFPGPTRTAHARRYSPDNSREAKRMPPEQVAEVIVRGVRNGRRRIIPGVGNQVLAVAGHLFPRLLEWSMKKAILEKLDENGRTGDKEMGR